MTFVSTCNDMLSNAVFMFLQLQLSMSHTMTCVSLLDIQSIYNSKKQQLNSRQ